MSDRTSTLCTFGCGVFVLGVLSIGGCATEVDPGTIAAVVEGGVVETASRPVVYGDDDRLDWYAEPDSDLRALTASSIVAQIGAGRVDESDPDDVRIDAPELGPSRDLCEDERFYDQPRAAHCSGTLIAPDLVLTAGHCISGTAACADYRFVFDYFYESQGALHPIVSDEDVYSCDEVLVRTLADGIDFAVVRLDREVHRSHLPASIRTDAGALEVGAALSVIGFGSGLPAKIDSGGRVLDPRGAAQDWFRATTDTFGGNSGSGVFDSETLEVVGILVRGERDYVDDEEAGCTRVNVLPEEPGERDGEEIVYASRAIEALCAEYPERPLCSAPGGWCRACEDASDCVEGWTCRSSDDGTGLSWCAAACETDDDCRSDHSCVDDGACAPRASERCVADDVWLYSACGPAIEQTAACEDHEICSLAACVAEGEGNRCDAPVYVEALTSVLIGEIDQSYSADARGSCGGAGRDRVYEFQLDRPRRLVATSTGFDTVLYLRTECSDGDSEVECDDDSNPPGDRGSRIDVDLDPGTYFLVVDAYGDNAGAFELDLRFGPICSCSVGDTRCGLGVLETCTEFGAECPDWQAKPCNAGATCVGGRCVQQGRYDACEDAGVIDPEVERYRGDLDLRYGNGALGSCGGAGPDAVYSLELGSEARVVATLSGGDALYVRSTCGAPGSELACSTGAAGGGGPAADLLLAAGTYYFFVDTAEEDRAGRYSLRVEVTPVGGAETSDVADDSDAGVVDGSGAADAGDTDDVGLAHDASRHGGHGCAVSRPGQGSAGLVVLAALCAVRRRRRD